MCMSHRRCFSTRQSLIKLSKVLVHFVFFFIAPLLLDNDNQDFNVLVAHDVEIGLTTLHDEPSTWQVMNPHPRTGQRPGTDGMEMNGITPGFCGNDMT